MPRIVITNELAEAIRGLRLEKKVSATSLADHIGKSRSYISKLEKGNIKTVSKDEFDSILRFIVAGNHSYIDRVDEILKVATYRYNTEEMEAQVWFSNFSTVFCRIPIPAELVDDINSKMKENGVSREYLCDRINANEFLQFEDNQQKLFNSNYPNNEWFEYPANSKKLVILMRVQPKEIGEILEKERTSIGYVFLQAISQYLFKIIEFKHETHISESASTKIAEESKQYLHSFNFYPISEKYRRLHADEQLSMPDQKNQDEIEKLNAFITVRSEYNVQRTNMRLVALNHNIEWDGPFMESLMALPFSDLAGASYASKERLLDQIKRILQDAISAQAEENRSKDYD